jgi:hypothetical protein
VSRPRFLADEDWRFEIVLAVRRTEPIVIIETVKEIGRAGMSDAHVVEYAHANGLLVLSHDVNTLRAEADRRVADGRGVAGVFLASQRTPTRLLVESILTIWGASEAEEWGNRIVFLPL